MVSTSTTPINYWPELTESGYSLKLVGTSNRDPERHQTGTRQTPISNLSAIFKFLLGGHQAEECVFFQPRHGYSIGVLIYRWCWIGLCVGAKKKCSANEIAGFGAMNFFPSYLERSNN